MLLLQELKGLEFPDAPFEEMGYGNVFLGQKSYNGVAILSRHPIEVLATALPGDEADTQARFLEARIAFPSRPIRVVNIYLPNGNPVGTDKFEYKLRWMERLRQAMAGWITEPTVVAGDYNVIPEEIDCHKPASWVRDALFQPETRAAYRALLGLGYIDAFRALHPQTIGQYTYWDYFRQAFETNRGIRIDHLLLSPPLAERLRACTIDRTPRGGERPSDHTPILVQLA